MNDKVDYFQTPQEFLEEYVKTLVDDRKIAAEKYHQAQPTYYGILTNTEYVTEEGYEDYSKYFFEDDPSGSGMDEREAFQYCWENELISEDDLEGELTMEQLDEMEGQLPEDVDLYEIRRFLDEKMKDVLRPLHLIAPAHVATNAMFLTEKEAKRHFDANFYHYSNDAHVFAMTAWRNPSLEKFLDTITRIDFDRSVIVFKDGDCNDESSSEM